MLFWKNNRVKNFQKKNIKNNNSQSSLKKRSIFLKKNLKKIFSITIFFIFWWVIFFIFFSNYFSVSQISFERKNFSFNPENISQDLEKFIWKNIFLINTSSIENFLEEKNPQFKKISVKKIYPETIYFEVFDFENIFEVNTYFTEKNEETWVVEKFLQKFLISQSWQLKNFSENISKKKSDKKSETEIETWTWKKIWEKIKKNIQKNISNDLKKIFIKEDLWKKLEIWEIFINWEILSKIQKINSYIETQEKILVESIFFWPKWKEIHFNTKNWNFYFTLSKNIDKQIEKIFYFKESKNINNLKKIENWENNFEYLDLRIAEKIIYK